MAKQRVVNTFFWNDDFVLDLRSDEKLMFLYILTNPQTDLCGAYQIAMKRMTFDTGLTAKRITTILEKFEAAGKICYRDGWMMVRNFAKHQVNNPKVAQGIERSLNACPDWVKAWLTKGSDSLSKRVALLPVLKPEPKPVGETAAEPEIPKPEPPLKEIHVGKVLAGVMRELGVSKLGHSREREWVGEAEIAFDNGFTAEQFVACFADVRSKSKYGAAFKPAWVNDRLPDFAKSNRLSVAEARRGPTARQLIEEARQMEIETDRRDRETATANGQA